MSHEVVGQFRKGWIAFVNSRIGWVNVVNGHSPLNTAQCKSSRFILFVLKDGHTAVLYKTKTTNFKLETKLISHLLGHAVMKK